jgi:hypothetical protein
MIIMTHGLKFRHLLKRSKKVVAVKPIDYERRNYHLSILGFNSYAHYLNSEMWQTIRQTVLTRDSHKCVVCSRKASEVHHNSYEIDVLIGKKLEFLVSLCRHHHEKIEFEETTKRDLIGAREALKKEGVVVPDLSREKLPKCCMEEKEKITENKHKQPGKTPTKKEIQEIKALRRAWYRP